MSTLTHARPSGIGLDSLVRFGQLLGALVTGFAVAQAASQEARSLMYASDRALSEKGLTRETISKHLFQKYFAGR